MAPQTLWQNFCKVAPNHIPYYLESTDAAPEVPHPRPTRRDAGRGVRCGCPCVGPRLGFFFFFFFFLGFAPMRLDSCRIGFDSRRIGFDSRRIGFDSRRIGFDSRRIGFDSRRIGFDSHRIGLIQPKSGRIGHIGHIGTYRPAADTADSAETGRKTAETGRKRPKSALSMAGKSETCILLSFFVNQGLVCVF